MLQKLIVIRFYVRGQTGEEDGKLEIKEMIRVLHRSKVFTRIAPVAQLVSE